jgi:hypothetical protein
MSVDLMHHEDVKAELRKRFGAVATFEAEYGLPKKSVHDVLRGRHSKRVSDAIEKALSKPLSAFDGSDNSACTPPEVSPHRLNAERE